MTPEIPPGQTPILYFSTRLIRAGVRNAYLPVLLPGRLLQLGGGALR
jgi:hypothetical protein